MRAVPIPDELVWEGAQRHAVGPPTEILVSGRVPVFEAVIDVDDLGPRFSMLISLEDGDLERLREEPHFWLMFHGDHLHAFDFDFPGIPEESGEADG